ncbi:DUF4163 domain-containing protein [Candidatus Saganbacteria bacterium]|nr:DUF4163 domain-containing protein [Candidatus Saganbacteria bacterium]
MKKAAAVIVLILLLAQASALSEIRVGIKKIASEGKDYIIDISYPAVGNYKNKIAQEKFNNEIRAIFSNASSDFIGSLKGVENKFQIDAKNGYYSTFEVVDIRGGIISILFEESAYYRGAAHPTHNARSINYDLHFGKNIALKDIFRPGTKWLEYISDYCLNDLRKQLDGYFYEDGVGQREQNFKIFNFTKNGVLFTFDDELAGHAAGDQRVLIPYGKLKNLMEPKYLLGRI